VRNGDVEHRGASGRAFVSAARLTSARSPREGSNYGAQRALELAQDRGVATWNNRIKYYKARIVKLPHIHASNHPNVSNVSGVFAPVRKTRRVKHRFDVSERRQSPRTQLPRVRVVHRAKKRFTPYEIPGNTHADNRRASELA
jgi:hypothetical protein